MKQLLQNMKNGATSIQEVPIPKPRKGMALVRSAFSLVSAGTERTLVEFSEKSLAGKAASRPDLVKQVMDKAKREGLISTIGAAFNRLDQPMFPGYSSAGTIIALGEDMGDFKVGDRVACGGGNHATHAEYCTIPRNLLVKIPDQVSFEEAAFTTLGAVAMHGFRLASPQLDENVLVIGLGLLGLMEIQIAKAAGCHVLGMDIAESKIKLARQFGVEACLRSDVGLIAPNFTRGRGFDHILICAGSKDNDSVALAGELCRDRGNLVAIGAVGLDIPRKPYYEKEINVIVSRSYGPGRYDLNYEEKGHDYPIGFVRWTECRNMESFVDLIAAGKMDVRSLISHRIPIEEGRKAYELITGKLHEPFLGVLLQYDDSGEVPVNQAILLNPPLSEDAARPVRVGVLGAGNYANATFLPVMKNCGSEVELRSIASGNGGHARHSAEKFGFSKVEVSGSAILDDPEINSVVLLTPHNLHAAQIIHALEQNKHVYCEKPAALDLDSLSRVYQAVCQHPEPVFTIGYNRRFAPLAQKLKEFSARTGEALAMHYTVNAGYIPLNHWTQDTEIGGGRILGEACHFVDFLIFLSGSLPLSVNAIAIPDNGRYNMDNVSIQLRFANGSIGTISYLANGDKSCPKERVEVFSGGRIAVLSDYRSLETWDNGVHEVSRSALKQDKGHTASWAAFVNAIRGQAERPIPVQEIFSGMLTCFAAIESIHQQDAVAVPSPEALGA